MYCPQPPLSRGDVSDARPGPARPRSVPAHQLEILRCGCIVAVLRPGTGRPDRPRRTARDRFDAVGLAGRAIASRRNGEAADIVHAGQAEDPHRRCRLGSMRSDSAAPCDRSSPAPRRRRRAAGCRRARRAWHRRRSRSASAARCPASSSPTYSVFAVEDAAFGLGRNLVLPLHGKGGFGSSASFSVPTRTVPSLIIRAAVTGSPGALRLRQEP